MNMTTFEQFKEAFEVAIENISNKDSFIGNEIREIESYLFSSKPIRKGGFKNMNLNVFRKSRRIFKININKNFEPLFTEAFQGYDLDGEFIDDRGKEGEYKIVIEQARQFCQYYQWLKEKKINPKLIAKKGSLTHKQKMLALHYLGLDTNEYDNSKLAKILSKVLELNEDNTRQYLSYVSGGNNEVRTIKNLKTVRQLYKNQGFISISNKIESDIEKTEKKIVVTTRHTTP